MNTASSSLPVDITSFFSCKIPEENDKTLIAFCDGSAINNGKPDCVCGYGIAWPYHPEHNTAELLKGGLQTNNRAEYMALARTMMIADALDPSFDKTLIVYTDSMLLINSLTKWVYAWKKNGWKKKDNHPVANVDLLVMLEDLREKRKLVLRHVKAHTGKPCWESRFNDKVDLMAKKVVTDFLRQKQDRHNKKIFTAANKTHKNPLDKLVMSLSE